MGILNKKTLAYYELWRRGIVAQHYLKPHQWTLYALLHATKRDIVVPNIARRFGKSSVCVTYAIEKAICNPSFRIRYATAFLSDLEGFIKPIFDDVLNTCPSDLLPEYNSTYKEYTFKGGGRIRLVGLDKNPNALRGNKIDLMIIDEAAFVSNLEYIYKNIIVPATANAKFKLVFPSTPPVSTDHFWARYLVPKAKMSNTYLEQTIDDNTSLIQDEKDRLIAELGGVDSVTVQREFYCKIIRDENVMVIPEYSSACIKKILKPAYYIPTTTIDLGGARDKHAGLITFWDFQRAKFCIYREFLLASNTPTSEVVKAALAMEKEVEHTTKHVDRVCDTPAQMQIDLGREGFHYRIPDKIPGSVEANVNALRLAFQRGEIELDPSCKWTRHTLENGAWDKKRADFERTDELGHLDLLAALLYAYRHCNKSNPYPKFYGIKDIQNTYIESKGKDAEPIRELFR